jgi:hypothetical protein
MRRLQADGIACGVIDITAIGSHNIAATEWYLGVVRRLAQSFRTEVNALQWWQEREGLSPLQRLSEFIEEVLLIETSQPIVIFIDEIDSVLKLSFKDDFFALIRSCYNQRAENPEYQRLTFALLGVATPSDLIQDKSRTPFNVGRAITLQGFQLPEVQPLAQGLEGKVDNPQSVLREILVWTGGQPFLTQKLCQLVLSSPFTITAGSEAELIEKLVQSRLIENWESQDEPEHLKTIRDRLLRDQLRAGRRLGLYQQILQQGEIAADDSYDQIELRLSGLVVEQQGKLRVYNRIYWGVFNPAWVEQALADLRPYAALITPWLASNCNDESRLLRGQALRDAQAWAEGRSLGDKDHQFLARSQEFERRKVQGALEAERQALERLAEANRTAKRRITIGSVVLVAALLLAVISVILAGKEVAKANSVVKNISRLSEVAGKLQDRGLSSEAGEGWNRASRATYISNHKLRQAMLFASISLAHQQLGRRYEESNEQEEAKKQWDEAEKTLNESLKQLPSQVDMNVLEQWVILVDVKRIEGNLLKEQKKTQEALIAYTEAFDTLKKGSQKQLKKVDIDTEIPVYEFLPEKQKILSASDVENLHREFIALLSETSSPNKQQKISEVKKSLQAHLLAELNYLMKVSNWKDADEKTTNLMLNIAEKEKQGYLDISDIQKFSCPALRTMDTLWVKHSDGTFGFSVQKRILDSILATLEQPDRSYTQLTDQESQQFAEEIGWKQKGGDWRSYESLTFNLIQAKREGLAGTLPAWFRRLEWWTGSATVKSLSSHCDL